MHPLQIRGAGALQPGLAQVGVKVGRGWQLGVERLSRGLVEGEVA